MAFMILGVTLFVVMILALLHLIDKRNAIVPKVGEKWRGDGDDPFEKHAVATVKEVTKNRNGRLWVKYDVQYPYDHIRKNVTKPLVEFFHFYPVKISVDE